MNEKSLVELREATMRDMKGLAEQLRAKITDLGTPNLDLDRAVTLLAELDVTVADMTVAVLQLVDGLSRFVLQLPEPPDQPIKATLRLIRGDTDDG